MENYRFKTELTIQHLMNNCFLMNVMEREYIPGLPLLGILNGNLCMKVPFLKYQKIGDDGVSLIFPVRYIITISLPEEIIVKFEDLTYNSSFANIPLNHPIGKHHHSTIAGKEQPTNSSQQSELFDGYDKIIMHIAYNTPYSAEDEQHFSALLSRLIEPSLIPLYAAIDSDFVMKYIMNF